MAYIYSTPKITNMIIRLDEGFFDFASAEETDITDTTIGFKTKYVSPLINLANQFAGATRPKAMGFSLNEYMADYANTISEEQRNMSSWIDFLHKKNPSCKDEVKKATTKILTMLKNFATMLDQVDERVVEEWINDLLYLKTFNGFQLQNTIIQSVAEKLGYTYKFGTKAEESKGIDGYIGDIAVSVKPDSYKAKNVGEKIGAKMIYYTRLRDGSYDVEFDINPKVLFEDRKKIPLKYFKGDINTVQDAIKLYNDGYNAVEGNVNLSTQSIATLVGKIPTYITGNYDLSKCSITSMEGLFPISVLGTLDISGNRLQSLKGAKEYVGGDFNVSDNPIKTFIIVPDIVGGDFIAKNVATKIEDVETLIRGKLITE